MKYNVTITTSVPNKYIDAMEDVSICWDKCTEEDLVFFVHLLRPGMFLTVEACNDEEI